MPSRDDYTDNDNDGDVFRVACSVLIPETPLGLEFVDHRDEVSVAMLAEEFRPDICYIVLGWNVLDADLALLCYLANLEET